MSLSAVQSGPVDYLFTAEFPSGFGFTVVMEATYGAPNLPDFQTMTDALRGAGLTVTARQMTGDYKNILTP